MSDDVQPGPPEGAARLPAGGSGSPAPAGYRAAVAALPAEIDIANADQVRADLLALIDHGYPVVVADMSRTSFCDCAGITALLSAGSYADRAGAQLRIVARARAVLRTFEVTGLLLALPVYANRPAALGEPDAAGSPPGSLAAVTVAPGPVSRLQRTDVAESALRRDPRQCP